MNRIEKKWYERQPWKAVAILILLLISPATCGASILLLFGLYSK